MFKPVIVAKKSWWVPANDGLKLAVQIDRPEQYQEAVLWKMERLVQAMGLEPATALADRMLRQDGAPALEPTYNPEHLVEQVLENSLDLRCMIREGSPVMAQAQEEQEATRLVEEQAELTWGNFLS